MGTVVLGTGSCLPKRILTNEELENIVETSAEWIRTRTGIESRRISGRGEQTYQLATKAAKLALEAADVDAADLGLVVVGTISSHMLMPSTACFVQSEIGAVNAFAYDLNAACSGFLYGLDLADRYIRTDPKMKVLVVGAETLSGRLNWQDRNTCILFGDGAGAAVFGDGEAERGIIGSNFASDGNLWRLLYMNGPESTNPDLSLDDDSGAVIRMEGREVFKYAVRAMEDSVRGLLGRHRLEIADIDLVIPHQANIRIINNLVDRLGVPLGKVFINVAKYGNTSAASIPIALDEANRQGLIGKGDKVLFCTFGGGLTWGASLITW